MKSLFIAIICLGLASAAEASYEPGFWFHTSESNPAKLKTACLRAMTQAYGSSVERFTWRASKHYVGPTDDVGSFSVSVDATLKNGLKCDCRMLSAPPVLKYVFGSCGRAGR